MKPAYTTRWLVCCWALLVLGQSLCRASAESHSDKDAPPVSFESHIWPILKKHCVSCHNPQKSTAGLDLSRRETLFRGSDNGPVIVPGDARKSLLFQLIQPGSKPHMPPKKQLSGAEINLVERWIAGMDPQQLDTSQRKSSPAVEHWAFVKPQRPELPSVRQSTWVINPIDRFVLAALEKHNLRPNPPASKYELIRRVTYDLTGLPPTPEEVEAFLQDNAADAYEKVVDRLLASPRYGERWARFWLDLARYADSDGFEFDQDRPYAYRYRDYLIRSFNEDKPYDRFILEQLAGDEIDPDNPDALIATGFCRAGPTVANQFNERIRLDELDDILSTTGSVFLGLTIGCARCHDHKYDPITQREYYQLLAVFDSLEKKDVLAGQADELAAYRQAASEIDEKVSQLKRTARELEPPVVPRGGTWQLDRDQMIGCAQHSPGVFYFGERTWQDYIFEVEVMLDRDSTTQIWFRSPRDDTGYAVTLSTCAHVLQRLDWHAGAEGCGLSQRANPVSSGQWHALRIALLGDDIKVFVNEKTLFDTRDRRSPVGGIGLAVVQGRVRFRHVRVRSLDGGTLLNHWPRLASEPLPEEERQARLRRYQEVLREVEAWEKRKPKAPLVMCVHNRSGPPRPTYLLYRGDPRLTGPRVQPAVPAVLASVPVTFAPANAEARTLGWRTTLARWIAHPDHPLTARVMVNRLWQWHFQRGIVETASNFGLRGSPPSHPELLDWLATEFVRSGWRLKPIHRLIVTSATYRQSSAWDRACAESDPDNVYLWRYPVKRLEAEAIRDAMLMVSGNLNLTMYGPGVKPRVDPAVIATGSTHKWPSVEREGPEHWRRSVYVFIKRSVLLPMLETFDAPAAAQSCDKRLTTTVPTQALLLMNNRFVEEQARAMARRLLRECGADRRRQVERAWWLALSRPPRPEEIRLALDFLQTQEAFHRRRGGEPAEAALGDLCHVIFNLNEFLYLTGD
ncbi:MAG: hypothetical protein C4297_05395 [Gemmataceae bacterium]